jgi:uncharacterized membrane protein YgcG
MACKGNLTCLMSWYSARIIELAPNGPASTTNIPSPNPAFKQGQADRQRWESWFAGLSGDYHAGAEYWATHHSDQHPLSCNASPSATGADWSNGCHTAQRILADSDLRRKTEPDYRRGWNDPLPSLASRLVVNPETVRGGHAGETSVTPTPGFPPLTGRIVDEAGLLSPDVKAEITGWLAQFGAAKKRGVVVATVKSLQGHGIEDYGYQLRQSWNIGEKGKNIGAILLVAPTEQKVRIEVGDELENELTHAVSSDILNQYILSAFRQNNYEAGIVAGTAAMLRTLGWNGANDAIPEPTDQLRNSPGATAPRLEGPAEAPSLPAPESPGVKTPLQGSGSVPLVLALLVVALVGVLIGGVFILRNFIAGQDRAKK